MKYKGSLESIKAEQRKLENGGIKVFLLTSRGYERFTNEEERVKEQLRKDILEFELWKYGNRRSIERVFKEPEKFLVEVKPQIGIHIHACPQQSPQSGPVSK